MQTYHIHINGLVQGVGFRPFVCRLATSFEVNGQVSNANNGLHIEFNASAEKAGKFYNAIIQYPPPNAIITQHHIETISPATFTGFTIIQSSNKNKPNLLLTPDIALCDTCKTELLSENDKRFQYPFTTCLHCGPRYSITTALPYDRENTTMNALKMCDSCLEEYNDISNRRHYSQTNSCKDCAIPIHFYSSPETILTSDPDEVLDFVCSELNRGSIIAVKGIGGYLLLCDACNETSINELRSRKQRPAKPFAVLYANIEQAVKDVHMRPFETKALKDKTAPIVLCELKDQPVTGICKDAIAPGLYKIGIVLPYAPLLFLIANAVGKPLVATSGNISGSPIIYKDKDALDNLFEIADYVLTYDRDIVSPQDDSVIQFTDRGQKIILRRSRGLAPNYFPNPFESVNGNVLAMGAELKAAFALQDRQNLYISQYLGNQGTLESQTSFKETLDHLTRLLRISLSDIIIDKHPGYFVSDYGKEIAGENHHSITTVQHHRSHFGAVLAENDLLNSKEQILGFIWDGTGYGDDGLIWGSEVFIFEQQEMNRVAHLDYFPQILSDKMSVEPRLSALSLLKNRPEKQYIIQKYFSNPAWQYYQQLIQQPTSIQTSSMGRFLDGIAAILGICSYNTYEGEAAMQLEAVARNCPDKPTEFYSVTLINDCLDWNVFLSELINDLENKTAVCTIAWKVFFSLAKMIEQISDHFNIQNIAFSGGVFQNALLVDILIEQLSCKKNLYFHQQLSPNDECISFGQLACFSMMNNKQPLNRKDKTENKQFQIPN